MFRASLLCYPWDLAERGIEDTLAVAQGEWGVTGLILVGGCPPLDRMLPRSADGMRRFRTGGGLCFRPDARRYSRTRCTPPEIELAHMDKWLAESVDACRRRGLQVGFAVATLSLGQVAARTPASACRDVFGDPSPARLCPSHPDVCELLCAIVEDVATNYSPDVLELHDFDRGGPDPCTTRHGGTQDLGESGDMLMSLCFCEPCRHAASDAGIDPEAAVRSTEAALRQLLDGAQDAAVAASMLVARDAVLASYVRLQADSLAERLAVVRKSWSGPITLHRRGDEIAETAPLGLLGRHVDTIRIGHEAGLPGSVTAAIEAARSQCEVAPSIGVEFRLTGAVASSPQALVSAVAAAPQSGVTDVSFADLALLRPPVTDAVKQAIRYARRSAGA